MMTFRIARHEFRFMTRSFQTLFLFALFFGFAFLLTANGDEFQSTARGGNVFANAPYSIIRTLLIMGIFSMIAVPSYMANTVLRDRDTHFDGILFSTPIRKHQYLGGRFLGALFAMLLAYAGAPLGMFLGTLWPWADPGTLGPMNVTHYLQTYFFFLVPSLMAMAALIFSVAVMTRHLLYTHLATLGLLILYLIASESPSMSALWDPFMWEVFERQTEYWTAAERNTQMIQFNGVLIANRLLWIGIACSFFALAYHRFSFRQAVKKVKIPRESKTVLPNKSASPGLRGKPHWGAKTSLRQLGMLTRFEMVAVLKSIPFLILMGFSTFLLILTLIDREVMYEVNALPLTRIMVSDITNSLVLALLGVLIFYSAEIIWRERVHKVHEILDAIPVANWVIITSKLTALMAVIYSILLLGVGIAMVLQATGGYFHFEIPIYLEHALFYFPLQFMCLAVLACFFQVLGKNRLVGMLLMGVYMGVLIGAIDMLNLDHPLLRYGIGGIGESLSDMNGAGRFVIGGNWVRAYCLCIAGFLLMFTYLFWNRGTLQPLRYRLRALRAFKSKRLATPALLLLAGLLGTATIIYYNTNLLNTYMTRDDRHKLQVIYENKYRPFQSLPMPKTVAVKMDVDLFPYRQRIETRGHHVLQNKTSEAIEAVHIVFPNGVDVPMVVLEGGTQTFFDDAFNYYIFECETPIEPGEKRKLEFETLIQRRGFPMSRADTRLVRNGTFIHNNQVAPHIGFNPDYLIDDPRTRETYGLPALPHTPRLEDTHTHNTNDMRQDSDFVTFETTVSTVSNQTAVSVGYLEKEWTQGDRRYFTYKMDQPIRNFYPYLSAEYEIARDSWQDVAIEVYYHQPHQKNVERMIAGVKDSLDYFSEAFSPYQYKQVRILEFPAYRNFAQSFPNTIPYSESMGFVADVQKDDLDMPYYVTAHEMAHQWWGFQVVGAHAQGASLIHETLAQYSALLVMEQKYGAHQIRKFLKLELDRYLTGRADDPEGELPLYRVEKQAYVYYRKGSLAMYALRDYLGVEIVNRSLRRLIELRAYSANPYAISTDFLQILKQEAGPEHQSLIEDLFEKITLFSLKLENCQVMALENGQFEVSIEVSAEKFYADALGNEQTVPMNLPVDIGLFLKNPNASSFADADVIRLEKQHLTGTKTTFAWIVNQKPAYAGIDPYHKLIDREPEDNLKPIKSVEPAAKSN